MRRLAHLKFITNVIGYNYNVLWLIMSYKFRQLIGNCGRSICFLVLFVHKRKIKILINNFVVKLSIFAIFDMNFLYLTIFVFDSPICLDIIGQVFVHGSAVGWIDMD